MERLQKFGFKSRLHLISNGIIPDKVTRIEQDDDPSRPFLIACIGRLAVEKDQPTLLEAMKYSKYAKRIQLYFLRTRSGGRQHKAAGHFKLYEGRHRCLRSLLQFHDREGLRKLAAKADLYIHCATVEVEGLSALEALQQAVVPVIAEGKLTATSQFALDEHSLFPTKDRRRCRYALTIGWTIPKKGTKWAGAMPSPPRNTTSTSPYRP